MNMRKSQNDRVAKNYGRMTTNDLRAITGKSSAELLKDIATGDHENLSFEGRRVSPQ